MASTLPQFTHGPGAEQNLACDPEYEHHPGGGGQVRSYRNAGDQGRHGNQRNEEGLDRVPEFSHGLLAGGDPLQPIEHEPGKPNRDRGKRENLSNQLGHIPNSGSGAPSIAKASQAQDHSEEGRRDRRW